LQAQWVETSNKQTFYNGATVLFRTECAKKKVFLEVYAILTPKIFLLAKDFFFVVVDIWFALIMFSNKNTHSVGLRH